MRPVRLTMQAFGPYAGREVIDFREAVASGLFGIYGQTGSGKSTIFSAMTFALFGEAAKTEQETASLRSDHADPALLTEVEFIFDVGDRRYVVRRRPEQMRPKQRGAGETRDAHEAWLFDATGIAVEEISETHTGKIIAEKKISVIREAVADLLGYGAEQFRQIVMLPQGRFENFLAAKTDDRLAILRELFDVSIHRRLAAKLKEDAAAAERLVRHEREICAGRLSAEGFESVDALAEGIVAAKHSHEQEVRQEAEASLAVSGARGMFDAAGQLDTQFQAAEKAKTDLDVLLQRHKEINALKDRVVNARRAQALADVEGHFRDAEADLAKAVGKRNEASLKSANAAEAAQLAVQALEEERTRAEAIEELRKKGEALERHLQTLADAAGLEETARDAGTALSKAQIAFDAAVGRCTELSGQKRSKEASLKLAKEKDAERRRLAVERNSLEATRKAAEDYEKAENVLAAARTDVGRLKSDHAETVRQAAEAKACFEAAEANLAAAQALYLAAKLVPGEACPVCGSNQHPVPATGRIEHSGLDKTFRDAKTAWERTVATEQGSARRRVSAEATLMVREERLSELEKPERSPTDLRALIASVTRKIEELGAETDILSAEAQVSALGDEIAKAEVTSERLRRQLEEERQKEAVARDRLEQALSTIPDSLRLRDVLDAALAENRRALNARRIALEVAEKASAAGRENSLTAAKYAEAAAEAQTQASHRRDKACTVFETRLAESGLTEPLYQSYKPSIAMIESDTRAFEVYDRTLELARSYEETTRLAIAGHERPDLTPVEKALREAEESLKQKTNSRAKAEARLQQLQNLQFEIAETLRRLEQVEAETAPLRELAALFNAENVQRLDLETFAIGAMFDHVLVAANQRLAPMTVGRYTLEREVEGSGGRARRGLGIRVCDVYTGKPRSPATLSGGEAFIAALALALGLSDVVESASGKVRLDTIFIDEGFGSLDTENESGTLDQVLQALTNLVSQRRAVGLISHVPLVQEAVPNGFYIRKEARGSRVESRGAF